MSVIHSRSPLFFSLSFSCSLVLLVFSFVISTSSYVLLALSSYSRSVSSFLRSLSSFPTPLRSFSVIPASCHSAIFLSLFPRSLSYSRTLFLLSNSPLFPHGVISEFSPSLKNFSSFPCSFPSFPRRRESSTLLIAFYHFFIKSDKIDNLKFFNFMFRILYFWIPAYAEMTEMERGNDGENARITKKVRR